jgi:hypothetical protein
MNKLTIEKRAQVVAMICEGNSINPDLLPRNSTVLI